MKRNNIPTTFTVIKKKKNNNSNSIVLKQDININKMYRENNNKEKTKNLNIIYNCKNSQYNSVINIYKINKKSNIRNIDNNVDNNTSSINHLNKELITSNNTIYNFEELDEKIDVKLPCNKHISNSNSLLNSNKGLKISNDKNNEHKQNLKYYMNKGKNSLEPNIADNNYTQKFFQTFYLSTNKEKENNLNEIIGKKKININDYDIDNQITKVLYHKNNNGAFQGKSYQNLKERRFNEINLNLYNINNTFEKGEKVANEKYSSKRILEYSKNDTNNIYSKKRFFSMNKKDLANQFNKNHNYIKNIIEKLPQSKSKNMKNNINLGKRKYLNKQYSCLNNKDNNIDNFNHKKINNLNDFNNSKVNTSLLDKDKNDYHCIKSMRISKYLNIDKQNIKNNFKQYNRTYLNGFYNYNNNMKASSIKSAYYKKKTKNYPEFIFNIYNRKFKHLFISFLDIKTTVNLSSTNCEFFKNIRESVYTYFYSNLIAYKNKDKFIYRIFNSIKKYCSEKIKTKIRKKEIKSFYQKLLKKNEIYDELITKDLLRTIPNDKNFNKGKPYYFKLYNILTSYSNFNQKIGYAQGLNFIVGQCIYLFNTEEEIFVFLDGFINLLKMDNYMGLENEKKMIHKLNELTKILNRHVPEIIIYLKEKSLTHDFFTAGWILTLFSTAIEREFLVIIWCFMIIFRWKFFNGFIIQILKKYEKIIFLTQEGQLCRKMKEILKQKEFKNDFNEIIKNTFYFMKNNIII